MAGILNESTSKGAKTPDVPADKLEMECRCSDNMSQGHVFDNPALSIAFLAFWHPLVIQAIRHRNRTQELKFGALAADFESFIAVAGLMLTLLYGRNGWFAPLIRATNFPIVFAFPGE